MSVEYDCKGVFVFIMHIQLFGIDTGAIGAFNRFSFISIHPSLMLLMTQIAYI